MATWGSYADITAGEPGALLGFLGPRVYEALHDELFPPSPDLGEPGPGRDIDDVVHAVGGCATGWRGF